MQEQDGATSTPSGPPTQHHPNLDDESSLVQNVNDKGYRWGNINWSQSDEEVNLEVGFVGEVAEKVLSGAKLDVAFTSSRVRCRIRGEEPFFDAQFPFTVQPSECMWMVDGKKVLQLTIEKEHPRIWRIPCVGFPKADLGFVDIEEDGVVDDDRSELIKPVQVTDPEILKALQEQNPDFNLVPSEPVATSEANSTVSTYSGDTTFKFEGEASK